MAQFLRAANPMTALHLCTGPRPHLLPHPCRGVVVTAAVRTPSSPSGGISPPPLLFRRRMSAPLSVPLRVPHGSFRSSACIYFCYILLVVFTSPISFSSFLFYIISLFPALQGLESYLILSPFLFFQLIFGYLWNLVCVMFCS